MKQQLDELSKRSLSLIQTFAAAGDVDAVTRLSETPARIKTLQQTLASIESDALNIGEFLDGFTPAIGDSAPSIPVVAPALAPTAPEPLKLPIQSPVSFDTARGEYEFNSRGPSTKLCIYLDWSALGKPGGRERIFAGMASNTMAKLMQKLGQSLGIEALERLTKFQVSRGPLLSKDPRRDFVNRSRGNLYGYQPVPGTPYFVLTHSSTSQKIGDVNNLTRFLGLPPGAIVAKEAEDELARNAQ